MKRNQPTAFTIIETIAVVSIVAFLAAAILLPMIRHLDLIAAKKETATLKTMAEAYKTRSTITKTIPSETGWAAAIGAQLGWELKNVTNNDRGLRRVFLIDPVLFVGNNGSPTLPYTQSINGHTITNNSTNLSNVLPPNSPRLMLISSMSVPLPSALVSGVGDTTGANAFTNLWATAEGAKPTGWTWSGSGDDLKIQRINLSDLFVQVILNNRDTNSVAPTYRIDELNTNKAVQFGAQKAMSMYFLKGTELKLYNGANSNEYSEILKTSKSFTFEFGTWQGEAFVANAVSQVSSLDLSRIMKTFMNAPTNPSAKFSSSQTVISNAMVGFMNEYIAWRDGSPSYDGQFKGQGSPPKALEDAQVNLSQVTSYLITRPP